MNIIAQTKGGYLIEATTEEVKSILQAVSGPVDMSKVTIGHKLPAIDYAQTITDLKGLKKSYTFKGLSDKVKEFNDLFGKLVKVIESAETITEE